MELLLKRIEEKNFDIRLLSEDEIREYLYLKFKQLDFGAIFNKESAEEQLEADSNDESVTYTEEQWDNILENLFAMEEYDYMWNFLRIGLQQVHSAFPELYEGINVLPLLEIGIDALGDQNDIVSDI